MNNRNRIEIPEGHKLYLAVRFPDRTPAEGQPRALTFVAQDGKRVVVTMTAGVYAQIVRNKLWRQHRKLIVAKQEGSGMITAYKLIDNPEYISRSPEDGVGLDAFNLIKLRVSLKTRAVEVEACPKEVPDSVLGQIVDLVEKIDPDDLQPGKALSGKQFIVDQVMRDRNDLMHLSVDPNGVLG